MVLGIKSSLYTVYFGCALCWPAQGYYDACGFCFLLTNFARSMQSAVEHEHAYWKYPMYGFVAKTYPYSALFPRELSSQLYPTLTCLLEISYVCKVCSKNITIIIVHCTVPRRTRYPSCLKLTKACILN